MVKVQSNPLDANLEFPHAVKAALSNSGIRRAKLIADDGNAEYFPLLPLIAASPVLCEAAGDVTHDDCVDIHIVGFTVDTVQLLLFLLMNGSVTECEEQLVLVGELCDILMISAGRSFQTLPSVNSSFVISDDDVDMKIRDDEDENENNIIVSDSSKTEDDAEEKTEHECPMCDKKFHLRILLKKHVKCHSSPFQCLKCGVSFLKRDSLVDHDQCSNVNSIDLPFSCIGCKKQFATEKSLAHHRSKCLVLRKRATLRNHYRHSCTICPKVLGSKEALAYHTNIHLGLKPYSCNVCNSAFRTFHTLEKHTRFKHRGTKQQNAK